MASSQTSTAARVISLSCCHFRLVLSWHCASTFNVTASAQSMRACSAGCKLASRTTRKLQPDIREFILSWKWKVTLELEYQFYVAEKWIWGWQYCDTTKIPLYSVKSSDTSGIKLCNGSKFSDFSCKMGRCGSCRNYAMKTFTTDLMLRLGFEK